jgi:hypothetical protein
MGSSTERPVVPYDERDEDSGQFTPTFTDEEFLDAVEDGDLPTTNDVADAVGCQYRTAYARLGELEDEGKIASRTVGNSLVWMSTGDG